MTGDEQLSVPTGVVYATTAPQMPGVLFTERFAGQVMAGNSVSVTVTVNELVDEFPDGSVAVKVFVVDPTGNVDPLARPAVCVKLGEVTLKLRPQLIKLPTSPLTPSVIDNVQFPFGF